MTPSSGQADMISPEGPNTTASLAAKGGRRWTTFAIAVFAALLFHVGALRKGSTSAGYTFAGDFADFCWPSLVKLRHLLSKGIFTALDISHFNGSTDAFLSPNLYNVHPIFVIFSIVSIPFGADAFTMQRVLTWAMALSTLMAVYYCMRLGLEFLEWDFLQSTFFGVLYGCSIHIAFYMTQPMFVLCAAPVPWIAVGCLRFLHNPNGKTLLLGGAGVLFALLGGYLPLGLAAVSAGAGLAAVILISEPSGTKNLRWREILVLSIPVLVGIAVVSPFLAESYRFLSDSPSYTDLRGLAYSAHDRSDSPEGIVRMVARETPSTSPIHETTAYIGLAGITILLLAFQGRRVFALVSVRQRRLALAGFGIFVLSVLITYGDASPFSDLFHYLVPALGGMHIYQRYLLITQVFVALALTVALSELTSGGIGRSSRSAMLVSGAILLATAYVRSVHPEAARSYGLTASVVLEVLGTLIFLLALRSRSRRLAFTAALLFCNMSSWDVMLNWSLESRNLEHEAVRKPVSLQPRIQSSIVDFVKRNSQKDLVKYVDLTAMWNQGNIVFPKSFPYWVSDTLRLSSYHGFNFYLGARRDYLDLMPIAETLKVIPNWRWIEDTGADFAVVEINNLDSGAVPRHLAPDPQSERLRLPNDLVMIPLKPGRAGTAGVYWDNGVFRLRDPKEGFEIENVLKGSINAAAGRPTRSSGLLGPAGSEVAVDGVVDGDNSHRTVFHSAPQEHAWWEVDLGEVKPINGVRIYNRTDCCQNRLESATLYVSAVSFPTEASSAGKVSDVQRYELGRSQEVYTIATPGARGRYVRIQAESKAREAILNFSEVQVLSGATTVTQEAPADAKEIIRDIRSGGNFANEFEVAFENSEPITVEYIGDPVFLDTRLAY